MDFFINTFQVFLPRHVTVYGCHPPEDGNHMSKYLGVENLERINKKSSSSFSICWSFYKRYYKMLRSTIKSFGACQGIFGLPALTVLFSENILASELQSLLL
jgi:hypothetical protein